MATTYYGVNSPVAVKLWSKKLFTETLKTTWISKFMGSTADAMVQVQTGLGKQPGDTLTVTLRALLQGTGTLGDGTLEGNEEALAVYTDQLKIDQLRHAVRSGGKMSEQRITFDIRDEAKSGLRDWWADRLDYWFFNQICGNTAQSDVRYTGLQATIAPDSAHYINAHGTGSVDENIISTDIMTLKQIDYAVEKAATVPTAQGASPIRPIRVNGEDKYVMFLHDYQVTDLRTNTSNGQWLDIQKAAMAGGQVENNPIYSGALGEYNGVILHKSNRVSSGVNSTTGVAIGSVKRAVLCGAQAAIMGTSNTGNGSNMEWNEELFDYGNQLGVESGMIGGLKKTRFNGMDYGVITISTYGAVHS